MWTNRFSRATGPPLVAALAVAACGGGDSLAGPKSTSIDESGGVAESEDGLIAIEFPEGAVDGEAEVTIDEVAAPDRDDLYTGLYEITMDGELLEPVIVEMELAESPPSDADVQLARYDGGEPEAAGTSAVEDGVLRGMLTSFSTYGGFDLSASDGDGGTRMITGEVSSYYDGDGHRIYNQANNDSGIEAVAEGELAADGTFSFELKGADIVEDFVEPPAESSGEGFRGLVCIDEIMDQIEPGAGFLAVQHVSFAYTRADGSTGVRLIELSTRTEGESRANTEPLPGPLEPERQIYVYWLYTTHPLTVEQTCSQGSIDVELSAGWNEIVFDNTDRDNLSHSTEPRPAEVDWYLEPADSG